MTVYVDTSALVAGFTPEASTLAVQAWLADNRNSQLATSPWIKAEFFSALAMKRRLNLISELAYAETTRQFIKTMRETFLECAVLHRDFETAATFVARRDVKLRAADALHLAIVSNNDLSLCTLDRDMFQAATVLGIPCTVPIVADSEP